MKLLLGIKYHERLQQPCYYLASPELISVNNSIGCISKTCLVLNVLASLKLGVELRSQTYVLFSLSHVPTLPATVQDFEHSIILPRTPAPHSTAAVRVANQREGTHDSVTARVSGGDTAAAMLGATARGGFQGWRREPAPAGFTWRRYFRGDASVGLRRHRLPHGPPTLARPDTLSESARVMGRLGASD
jgi:hypothetical protein